MSMIQYDVIWIENNGLEILNIEKFELFNDF